MLSGGEEPHRQASMVDKPSPGLDKCETFVTGMECSWEGGRRTSTPKPEEDEAEDAKYRKEARALQRSPLGDVENILGRERSTADPFVAKHEEVNLHPLPERLSSAMGAPVECKTPSPVPKKKNQNRKRSIARKKHELLDKLATFESKLESKIGRALNF